MTAILPLLLCLIMFACVALLFTSGMWSNAITLINVVTAGLLATNYFEPLARWLDGMMPSLSYMWDFFSLWILFITFTVTFRILTGMASKVNVRFLAIADKIGSVVFAAIIGWIMICFTLMTLHTAPLGRNFLFGGFKPGESMFFGMFAPDQEWLGLAHGVSQKSFSRSLGDDERGKYGAEDVAVFDAQGRFIANYAERRTALEKMLSSGKNVWSAGGDATPR
jgi:hypothetical protein